MNVRELIEELKKLNPNLMVVVDGYEGGVSELKTVGETTIRLNANDETDWWYGRHEECDPNHDDAVTVCYLPR